MLQIIWHQHDKWKIPNARSGHLPGFDAMGSLVGAGCPQGAASTRRAFQPIIYPKVQQVHNLIFDASSDGI